MTNPLQTQMSGQWHANCLSPRANAGNFFAARGHVIEGDRTSSMSISIVFERALFSVFCDLLVPVVEGGGVEISGPSISRVALRQPKSSALAFLTLTQICCNCVHPFSVLFSIFGSPSYQNAVAVQD